MDDKLLRGNQHRLMLGTNNSNYKDYDIQVLIGQGGFGSVQRAVHRHTGSEVAIKIYEKNRLQND